MSSPKNRDGHPIRLVRNKYLHCGLRHLSTAAGFARMIGCSDSLVRNSESGIIQLSDKLALRIEQGTGVSAKWLQDATAKWRRGDDITNEPILNTQEDVWSPPRQNKFHFTDEFGKVTEMLYQHFPDFLPAFMGAVMESFLTIEAPPSKEFPFLAGERNRMRKYIDSRILPVIRMVDKLGEDGRERFYDALTLLLGGGRDAAVSAELLKLWDVMDPRNRPGMYHPVRPPHLDKPVTSESWNLWLVNNQEVPLDLRTPASSELDAAKMSNQRATKRSKSKSVPPPVR